jgi:hypothetical protein
MQVPAGTPAEFVIRSAFSLELLHQLRGGSAIHRIWRGIAEVAVSPRK